MGVVISPLQFFLTRVKSLWGPLLSCCDLRIYFKRNRRLIWYNLEHKWFSFFGHDSGNICHFSFASAITRGRTEFSIALTALPHFVAQPVDFTRRYCHLVTVDQSHGERMSWKTIWWKPHAHLLHKQSKRTYKRLSENCDKAPPACLYTIDYWVLDGIIIRFAFLICQSPSRWRVPKYYKPSGGPNWFANNWKL